MALPGSLQLSHNLGLCRNQGCNRQNLRVTGRSKLHLLSAAPSSRASFLKPDFLGPFHNINKPIQSSKVHAFKCHSFLGPGQPGVLPVVKTAATALTRSYNVLQSNPIIVKLIPAAGIIIFAIWGVGPLMRQTRNLFFNRTDSSWKKSRTNYVVTSYLQPLLLWFGAVLMCRALDPVYLPTEAGQVVKERLLNFVRSLSTVLAFAYCLSGVIQQAQKFFVDSADTSETRNMGFQLAGKAVYSAVWVAAFSLFMELLGFSTQKWVTAGGLGTVLLTLAGREIFTNFLSSAMIHATRPFVVNEWIQTKIEGYEVSGTVEHVGWWSPTVIRGEDREAIHIPNHKFTVNVVRNLSQKTHWRIKTHLAISHLDAKKINNIVADMRKVLAKNPQVEQQRLHRRVFLDNINPETQGLLILVSCFVKTSHHEEYLCVKEAILLDLLRVIGHHRARLATPVRTLQKIYSDADLDNIPFVNSAVPRRPLLMIEPAYKINADDKTKTRSARTTGERDSKTTVRTKLETPDTKTDAKVVASDTNGSSKSAMTSIPDREASMNEPLKSDLNTILKDKLEAPDMSASNFKANGSVLDNSTQKTLSGSHSKVQSPKDLKQNNNSDNNSSLSSNADKAGGLPTSMPSKLQDDKKPVAQAPTSRPVLEDNIVLDVALGGSKKTLSIEGIESATSREAKEMAACQGVNGSPKAEDRKDK